MRPLSSLELSSDKITFKKNELAERAGRATFTLVVNNISTELVAVKLKTTSPGTFIVQNNNFVLQPGDNRGVDIELAPTKDVDEDPASVRLKQKFLVTAATVTSDRSLTSRDWADMDQGQIQSQKLPIKEAVLPERILTMTAAWDEEEEMTVKATLLSGSEVDTLVVHPAATLHQVRGSLGVRLSTDFTYKLVTASGEILHDTADHMCFAHLMQLGITESFVDHDAPPTATVSSLTRDSAKRATLCIAVLLPLLLCMLLGATQPLDTCAHANKNNMLCMLLSPWY